MRKTAGIITAMAAISRCSSAEGPHCRGTVDGLGCREDLQEDQLLALHDRLFNRAVVGRFGKQAAVMEIEGGCGRRPRTGEPFTAERVAVFHEGRDAAE